MINRSLLVPISEKLQGNKAILILGPRQVGKSTLLQQVRQGFPEPVLWLNGDEADIRTLFSNPTSTALRALIGSNKTVVIDEAQWIENIGITLKLIIDQLKDVQLIATGSSSFDLSNKLNEPLTGRKWEFRLFPLSFAEMAAHTSGLEENRLLNHRLVYGYYPEVVLHPGEEEARLKELSQSYLYKDILTWERILKPEKLEKLIQALAFQVGNEVSYHELGQLCGLDSQTAERYIDLLEKAFIIFRLGSLSRNLRNELKKSRKIYFYDNGIRNAIINQFSPVNLRADTGALWENFLVSERIKMTSYAGLNLNRYFWRTHARQEIDYIEERNGQMKAWEFKWNRKAKMKIPITFSNAYPGTDTNFITPENYQEFLT